MHIFLYFDDCKQGQVVRSGFVVCLETYGFPQQPFKGDDKLRVSNRLPFRKLCTDITQIIMGAF